MAGTDFTSAYAETRRERRRLLLGGIAGTLVAVVYAVIAVINAWTPPGVDAEYSRLGGATRVETAAEVADFQYGLRSAVTEATSGRATAATEVSAAARRAVLIPVDAEPDLQLSTAALAAAEGAPVSLLPREEVRPLQAEMRAAIYRGCVAPSFDASQWPVNADTLTSCSPALTPAHSPVRLLVTSAAPHLHSALSEKGFEVMEPKHSEPLSENIVLVTANAADDYPDVAVAIPLAAAWDADVVVLPRRLEQDTDLRTALLNRTDEVRQGVVVGGPAAVQPELRTMLRAHAKAAASARRQKALSQRALVDSGVALAAGVGIFLAFRGGAKVLDRTADLEGGRRTALTLVLRASRDLLTRRPSRVPLAACIASERRSAIAEDRRRQLEASVRTLVGELLAKLQAQIADEEQRARDQTTGSMERRISIDSLAGAILPASDVELIVPTLTRLRHTLADLRVDAKMPVGDEHLLLFSAEYALLGWWFPEPLEHRMDALQDARELPDRHMQTLQFLRGLLQSIEANFVEGVRVVPNQRKPGRISRAFKRIV